MNTKLSILITCLFTSTLIFVNSGECQIPAAKTKKDRPEITGQFNLEQGAKAKDRSVTSLDEAIDFFEKLKAKVESLATGSVSPADNVTTDALNYISAAYLLCSVENGACPMYLESLLEADVINGRIKKSEECPNLKGFWKMYIDNDMENRFRFMSKLGLLTKTTDFNQNQRPKFIRCKVTVKIETTGNMSDSDFFKIRYKSPNTLEAINQSLAAIKGYKASNTNIFSQLAVQQGQH